ncbi:MAG: hypothetical protein HY235_03210 [Acidobacteria bacterium]|nr:hypothetical protein [Acidobacteriota bacterium]
MLIFTTLLPIAGLLIAADDRVRFDTDQVKVLLVTNAPGQKSQLHKHDVNRVMIYLDAGQMRLAYQDGGVKDLKWKAGEMRWDPAGGLHTSENTGRNSYRIVEVELNKPKGSPAAYPVLDPVKVDPKHYKVELENDQVRVVRARFPPNEGAPLHEHALPRVVVYLTDYRLRSTAADGTVSEPSGKAGGVAMPGPGKHSEVNLNAQPFEVLVIELKTR